MTTSDLIDYLQQLPGNTRVLLHSEDADAEAADADDYIVLDVLDFS